MDVGLPAVITDEMKLAGLEALRSCGFEEFCSQADRRTVSEIYQVMFDLSPQAELLKRLLSSRQPLENV